jgi:hypothetical protein
VPVTIREAAPADFDVVMRHRRAWIVNSLGFTPTNEMRLHL